MPAIGWGIAGTGLIAQDFASALQYLGPQEHQIAAVASRFMPDAQKFADKYEIPEAYDCYHKLATNPEVEIVYIAVIHTFHFSLAKQMLENGKHVLCEKTLCMNVEDTKELVKIAREKKLFLMEGIWSRCFPVYQKLQELIADGSLGQIVQVNATFGKPLTHVPRIVEKQLGGGVLFDIGIYLAQIATLVLGGGRKPTNIKAVGEVNEDSVDLSAIIAMSYEDGSMASLNCTVKTPLKNNAFVVGTKGIVEIKEPFWCPDSMVLPDNTELKFDLPQFEERVNFDNSEGLIYEVKEVRRCLRYGLTESPLITLNESIIMAEIIDEVRRQIGAYETERN
ncbi:hypothetical protein CHUAL_001014 [Chamberlinius hualienensis]